MCGIEFNIFTVYLLLMTKSYYIILPLFICSKIESRTIFIANQRIIFLKYFYK